MIVDFFRHGAGLSKGCLDYLLGEDRERENAEVGVVSGNGKYSTLRFFNCAQWPKFSTTYLGFASP